MACLCAARFPGGALDMKRWFEEVTSSKVGMSGPSEEPLLLLSADLLARVVHLWCTTFDVEEAATEEIDAENVPQIDVGESFGHFTLVHLCALLLTYRRLRNVVACRPGDVAGAMEWESCFQTAAKSL